MTGIIVVVVIVFVGLFILNIIRKQKLKEAYQRALMGTDKQAALMAGRAYYASLRKDKVLTTYDETAINNDISTMKS